MTPTRYLPPIRRLLLAAALSLCYSAQAVSEAQFEPAFATFAKAAAGDSRAIEPAASAFAALVQAEPANPVLLAYHGAATAMQASTTWLPWRKMTYAEDGLAQLDKALSLLTAAHSLPLQHGVPATLEVRLVAASTFLAVPGFMNRSARGSKLLAEVLDSPLLATSPLGFRGDVWMAAAGQASQAQNADQARRYLNLVLATNAPQATAARAKLKALAA